MENYIRPRLSHSNSFGNDAEKDTAGCRALNRKYIVIGDLEKDLSEYTAYSYAPYFNNGYLTFLISGADGLLYIATIDSTTMNFSFEPVAIESMFTIFYNNQAIVTLQDGNSARVDLTTGEIEKLPFNVPISSSYSEPVSASLYEGIIALKENATQKIRFYNWDGQEIVPIVL